MSTSDLDDRIASIKLFSLVQNSRPSSSQQPNPYPTTSASQPTTIGIDVLDAKGKSISPSGIESDFNTADPDAILARSRPHSRHARLRTSFIPPSSTNNSELNQRQRAAMRAIVTRVEKMLENLEEQMGGEEGSRFVEGEGCACYRG